jgi:hypothetical protein
MKKKVIGFCIGVVFILICCQTINAIQITKTIKESSKNNFDELNPKILKAIDMVNETLLRKFLEDLVSFGPRMTGTYGCDKAAEYIYERFDGFGLDTRFQEWASLNNRLPLRYYKGKNVEATLNGTNKECEEIIVFNAHYDTVKVSPGANDDGSGVVAVLAAAYILNNFQFNRTIKFVTFSGEEIGLIGSRAYVKEIYENNGELLVEFNADMIGYAETAQGGRNVTLSPTSDAHWIIEEIGSVNNNYSINFNINVGGNITTERSRGGSDYYDFMLYGYEVIAFWESEWKREYFHTEEDTIDHVNFSYLVNVTKLIVGSLAHLADMVEINHPMLRIGTPKRGRLYFEDRTMRIFRHHRTIVFDDVLIFTEVKPGDSPIEKVEFYFDGKLKYTDTEKPYYWRINQHSFRKHTIKAIVYDEMGRTSSDEINLRFVNLMVRR